MHLRLLAHFPPGKPKQRADKVQVPGTETAVVQQKHSEAKVQCRLGGESTAGAGTFGRKMSWWAFKQTAEKWTLPCCWKQYINNILHVHPFSQISCNPQTLSFRACLLRLRCQQPVLKSINCIHVKRVRQRCSLPPWYHLVLPTQTQMHFIYILKENKGPLGCNAMFQRIYFGGEVHALPHVLPSRQYFRGGIQTVCPTVKEIPKIAKNNRHIQTKQEKTTTEKGQPLGRSICWCIQKQMGWNAGIPGSCLWSLVRFFIFQTQGVCFCSSLPLWEACLPKLSRFSFCFLELLATSDLICLQNMPNL